MRYGIAETLERADAAPSEKEKIKILQDNASHTLFDIIKYAYDPNISFSLPKGKMKYQENPLPDCQNILYLEARRMYLFVEGGHGTLTQNKREKLFVGMLGGLDKRDAELLMCVKDKFLPYKTITEEFVRKVMPNLLSTKKENSK